MTPPSRRALAAATALGILGALAGAGPSAGQFPLFPTTTTSSSTTSTIPDPVTTTTEPTTTTAEPTTTTTEPDEVEGDTEPDTSTTVSVPESTPEPSPDDVHEVNGLPVPEWAVEKIDSVPRTGGNSTHRVLEKLDALLAFGFTPDEAALVGLGRFPVRGEATYADDWWYPRWTPEFHLHEGTDIFAEFGTPVTAPFDGVVTMGEGRVGGLYTYLTLDDGSYYYFAHLDRLPELAEDTQVGDPDDVARYAFRQYDTPTAYRVQEGDVIGYVGDSGNAEGGAPHLHLEMHPAAEGGGPVNPKPVLDEWLIEAEDSVDAILDVYTTGGPRAVLDTRRTRAGGEGQFAAPSRPLSAEILGVSSLGPGTGVQVVTEEVVRAVSRIDWQHNREALARPFNDVAGALASSLGI